MTPRLTTQTNFVCLVTERYYLCVRRIFTFLKNASLISNQEYRWFKHALSDIGDRISARALSTPKVKVTNTDGNPASQMQALRANANQFSCWSTAVTMQNASANLAVTSSSHTGITTVTNSTRSSIGWRPSSDSIDFLLITDFLTRRPY